MAAAPTLAPVGRRRLAAYRPDRQRIDGPTSLPQSWPIGRRRRAILACTAGILHSNERRPKLPADPIRLSGLSRLSTKP